MKNNTDKKRWAEDERVEQQMRRQWDLAGRRMPGTNVEEKLWERIASRTFRHRRSMAYMWVWRSLAAASVLLLLLGGWWLTGGKPTGTSAVADELQAYYSVQDHTFILPDSSVVWMKAGSTIRYRKNFTANRAVQIDGEAVFDVRKKTHSPFKVYVGESFVEVKGTAFQVIGKEQAGECEVTLYRGAVEFTTSTQGQRVEMKPGQRLHYQSANGHIELKSVEMIDWDNGRYRFEDRPMDDLLRSVSCLYHVEVTASPRLSKQYRFNGYIRYDETLEEVLEKICYNTGLRYKKNDNSFVIYK